MGYLDEAVALMMERGDLPLPPEPRRRPGLQWIRRAPPWLEDLQRPGGFDRLTASLGVAIPAALVEFWSDPALVRILEAWRWLDYLAEAPCVIEWDAKPSLLFCTHPHSGFVGAAALGFGDDPPVDFGEDGDDSPTKRGSERFSEHVTFYARRGLG